MKKTVLITGASRGIGRACALAFGRAGYRVLINYLQNETAAHALVTELDALGVESMLLRADVSVDAQVDALFAQAGHVDVLINNAGIAWESPLQDMTEADWDRVQSVCLKSVFLCSRAVLGQMISRKEGAILNISSMWGLCGASCEVAYSAAKAGVIGLTKALAREVGPSGIRVNCIAPGVIDTDMNAAYTEADLRALCEQTPLGRIGTPDEVARAALFLAEHPFITGETLNVSGGFVI